MADPPRLDQLNAREAARLIVERERLGLEPLPLTGVALRFTRAELLDELDNLAIEELYHERLRDDKLAGRSLEQAARELGFDPQELGIDG
jgi:hypothetical protein